MSGFILSKIDDLGHVETNLLLILNLYYKRIQNQLFLNVYKNKKASRFYEVKKESFSLVTPKFTGNLLHFEI